MEAEPANDPDLAKAFQAWRQQGRPLKRTEIEQLGFRLAGRLGLPGVQGVDWMGMPPGELNQYDYEAWSEVRGEAAQAELRQIRADSQARSDAQFQLLGRQGLPAMLRALNDPAAQAADHQTYFRLARLGDEGWTAGANWVGTWMTRNLKMWQNLDRMAQPGDRVLLIVGAGHATLLKQFAAASGRFEVVDVLPGIHFVDTLNTGIAFSFFSGNQGVVAVVTLIAMRELGLSHDKVNVHGGACALGHPIGATGARILVTLVHALRQHGLRRGVASLCIGGGEATAMAIELI